MLEVRLIGKFDIRCDGKPVIIPSRTAQSLFAYLTLTAGTSHRREKLAGMFWPDATEEKARAYLRHELWRIRKAFPPQSKVDYLVADGIGIRFDASAEYWLDAAILDKVNENASTEELINALSLFQGELLPGFYDDWVTQEREHLQAIYEQKMAWLLELLESEKRWSDILEWGEQWISFGQTPEMAYRALMTAYDVLGDRTKVTSTYERCVQALRVLDLEPSEETRAIAFRRTSKLNIPIPLTSFIGREKELKEVADLLSKFRLVTLTGAGGVGKTRLAIQVAEEVLSLFPDGIWFLDLAPLGDPTLVLYSLANLIGLREFGDTKSPVIRLVNTYFRSRTALVIFDNCEHLIESCVRLVHSLLTSCEHLSILATSREALRVAGEISYRVPSLEIPQVAIQSGIETLGKVESVRLFAERAMADSPGFAINPQNALTIAHICQRLDGIPLAIELAAARINVLSVEQILNRLDDRFNLLTDGMRTALPRQQTLRATVDWSYSLLPEKERILFRRLAVFTGGWTLESAEKVCSGEGIQSSDVLHLLSQLVNKSLVMAETGELEARYRRLEIIREFAREKLIEATEAGRLKDRHLTYYLQLSEQAESALSGPTQIEWISRLSDELDNIRSALEWAEVTNVEAGLSIGSRLSRFWSQFDWREGVHWLEELLDKAKSTLNLQLRAKALYAQAIMLVRLQQYDSALPQANECLALFRACGDLQGEIDGLLLLSHIASTLPQKVNFDQRLHALAMARSLGDVSRQAMALMALGFFGDRSHRREYFEDAMELFRQLEDWHSLAICLSGLGYLLVLDDEMDEAKKYLDESKALFHRMNSKANKQLFLAYARIAFVNGDFDQARTHLREGAESVDEVGNQIMHLWYRAHLGYIAMHEGKLSEASEIFAATVENFRQNQNIDGIVFVLEGMAALYNLRDMSAYAARLIGWADLMREKMSDPRPPLEQKDVNKINAVCIARMGEAKFKRAADEGKQMSLDEVVAYTFENI